MPYGDPPDYIHLRTNESQMQLISMDATDTPSSSPCFNGPAHTSEEPPAVIFIPGKGTARWWRSRTGLERTLIPTLILLATLVLVLLIVVVSLDRKRDAEYLSSTPFPLSSSSPSSPSSPSESTTSPPTEPPICTSPGCVRAANNLLNAMNQSVDPCDNFYDFACGAWNSDNPIPDDMFAYGTFSHVREQVRLQLRVLLEQDIQSSSKSINKARISYKTCMNKTQLDDANTTLLIATLKELKHWPLLQKNEWKEEEFSLTDLLTMARRDYGVDVFFQLYVYADGKNTTKNTIFIDQGSLTLGRGARDYYLNTTMFSNHITAYRKYLFEIMKILQSDLNSTRPEDEVKREIDEIISFETELARITVPEDERRNSTRMYNKRVFADLQEYMNNIDWVSFFTDVSPPDIKHYFHNQTEVILAEVQYLKKVSDLLSNTKPEVLANFIVWRVVQNNVRYLDERFEDIKQDFVRVMTGQQQRSPRWKECAQVPSSILPLAAGAVYVDAHFNTDDKREATEMITNLRAAFADLVNENHWMDEDTKAVAIEKAQAIQNNIGYPEIVKDHDKLDNEYAELDILPGDSYYSIMQKSVVWMQNKEFRKLLKPFDRKEFDVSPAIVNAFYSPERNAISFPAGILQPPFFSGQFPRAVNYGAMGSVIGHEITHGFDDQGSQYDLAGNLHNWWTAESLSAFDERRNCIVEQYSGYVVPKTTYKVNGKLTQGENIADNGGVKEAYRAYNKYVSVNGEEPRLPGLQQYTNKQIFFLSYAHFWCGQKKDAAAMQQVLTDEHSPEVFRVMGVLSNMDQFAAAYNCPKGSNLHPDKKCVVW